MPKQIRFVPMRGPAGGWFRCDHPGVSLSAQESPREVFLVNLWIDESARGNGLGTRVLRALKARAGSKPVVCYATAFDQRWQARLTAWYRREGVSVL